MLIILLNKTGIVISSNALFLCVGVTSSSESSSAQSSDAPVPLATCMHQLKQSPLPPFSQFFFHAFSSFFPPFFLTGSTNCVLSKLENISSEWHKKMCVLTLHLTFIKFFTDVSVFLYLFGMDRFYCEIDACSFAVPLSNVFYHVLTFKRKKWRINSLCSSSRLRLQRQCFGLTAYSQWVVKLSCSYRQSTGADLILCYSTIKTILP